MDQSILHPYFGTLDASGDLLWRGNAECDRRRIPVDMTSNAAPSVAQLDAMAMIVRDVARFDRTARQALVPTHEAVALYIEHHRSELAVEDLAAAFGTQVKSDLTASTLVSALVLRRVGLYPESSSAVFDYGLSSDVTPYVLAVTLGSDGRVYGIAMES